MPIFEMDDGRARLLQPMQPLPSSFLSELRGLLDAHLSVLVGEPLFAVRSKAALPERADGPELLALDAAGNPVLVEAVQVVDDAALVAVLRHAGTAARLTATDLARAYHADPTRFAVDYAAFREQVTFRVSGTDQPHVRVVLLCAEVATETSDALAALRASDARVHVLQVGVMRGSDDSRLLDVSPFAPHERVRRSVEPTALRLVRAAAGAREERAVVSPASASTPATTPVPAPHDTRVPSAPSPTVSAPGAAPYPTVPARAAAAYPTVPARAAAAYAPAPASASAPAAPSRTGSHRAPADPAGPELPSSPAPDGTQVPADPSSAPTRTRPPAAPAYEPVEPPTPRVEAPPDALPAPSAHVPSLASDRQWPLPELTTLAKRRQAVTLLVWIRERRGQRFEAMLRADGLIQLPDGSVFADPDAAAARAAGVDGLADGWRAWRLGAGGPTLAEAAGR